MALDRISKSHKRKHRNNKGIKKNILFFWKKNNSLERYISRPAFYYWKRDKMCCPDLCAANDAISTKYWMKNAFNIALQMQLLNGAFNLILKLKLSDFRQRNHFHRIDFTSALKS